jgi:hypothetical protein
MAGDARAVRAMPEDSPDEIAAKRKRFEAARTDPRRWNLRVAADLYVSAFLAPKTGGVPANRNTVTIPTTAHVWNALAGRTVYGPLVGNAQNLAGVAGAFHWPLEFPDVTAAGGFDVVLGNPPWEVMQLSEEEYFAQRLPEIAELVGAARKHAIAALETENPIAFSAFQSEKRRSEAGNEFARGSGRFALTAGGKVNTFALFAELFATLASPRGQAGVIVPMGIATDATTAPFFAALVAESRLAQLIDFENRAGLFPAIDSRMKFSLLTIGRKMKEADFAFFLTDVRQLAEPERRFTLSADTIARINPNTKTAPIFRSRTDAELVGTIHAHIPVLIDDGHPVGGNPWGVTAFTRIWNMAEDAEWFRTAMQLRHEGFVREGNGWVALAGLTSAQPALNLAGGRDDRSLHLIGSTAQQRSDCYVPLYEAKMVNQFDHRWATYDASESRDVTLLEKANPDFEPNARYWVPQAEVSTRLQSTGWKHNWLMGWRNITNATNERTSIFSLMPRTAVGHTCALIFLDASPKLCGALIANLNSLPLDFVARLKVGGTHLTFTYLKQFPVLPPSFYGPVELSFIVPRVLELAYTSQSMAPLARDFGYEGHPFPWDEVRRARLRAELDAWYARAYGLTRDELRYVLDPADAKGTAYPSETFRVLKKNEIARFGEYRTARLVMLAWDQMERGEIREISPPIAVTGPTKAPMLVPADPAALPDQAWAMPSDGTGADAATAQLAALVKALPGPTPISRVRLAALYALEPRYLTRRLSGADRATWRRVVGSAAELLKGTNIAAFAPKIDAGWRDAISQLRGMGALVEDTAAQTWAAGPKLDEFEIDPAAWPYGRATFVLKALEAMTLDDAIAQLPSQDQAWVKAHAA